VLIADKTYFFDSFKQTFQQLSC